MPKCYFGRWIFPTNRTQLTLHSSLDLLLKTTLNLLSFILFSPEQKHPLLLFIKSDYPKLSQLSTLVAQQNYQEIATRVVQPFHIAQMQKEKAGKLIPIAVQKDRSGGSENYIQCIRTLSAILNQPIIDLRKLRAYLANGLPQQLFALREIAWKIILGYLPKTRSKWQEQQTKQQQHYLDFIKHYLPSHRYEDYPLIMNKQHPEWTQHEQDFYLWQQIEKDTSRTQSELAFFSTPAEAIIVPYMTGVRKEKWKLINGDDSESLKKWKDSRQEHRQTYTYDYMTRILFIFAKVNPRAQYVQGMNQIIAPIFYLLNHRNKGPIQEAACFFMFNNVMSDLLELNIQDFDKRENGIHARMREVDRILLAAEPLIWQRMAVLKIDQVYYCFRWLTLLFAQQFQLFQILRIWESIFACQDRALYVNCFCVALLAGIKEQILGGTYSSVLTCIKKISESVSYGQVIFRALELYHEMKGLDVNTVAQYNLGLLEKGEKKEMKRTMSHKPRLFQKIVKKFI